MKHLVVLTARAKAVCQVIVEADNLADAKERAREAAEHGDWQVFEAPEASAMDVNSVDLVNPASQEAS